MKIIFRVSSRRLDVSRHPMVCQKMFKNSIFYVKMVAAQSETVGALNVQSAFQQYFQLN